MTQMDTQNQATKHLQGQDVKSEDDARAGIGPWLRWAANICTGVVAVGTALASPWVLWALAATAIAGGFLPNHPFDYIYNYGVRHLTRTPSLPPNSPQRKFALAIAGLLLAGTGVAFFVDATTLGYGMGLGAKVYVRFVRRPDTMSLLFRGVPNLFRAWAQA